VNKTPDKTSDPLTDALKQFGEVELANISASDLRASTVHLILATTFFTGALMGMAKLNNVPRPVYLRTLRIFFERRFGLNADHASGMIESNARLFKRYVLIERVFNAGRLAGLEWQKQGKVQGNELKLLLDKYPDLSMSGLNVEGTKEPKAPEPKPEPVVTVKTVTPQPESPPTRWGRTLLLLILLMLLICIGGAFLFEQQLSPYIPMLKPVLNSAREFIERLSTTLLDTLPSRLL
jgi:hypothetical protein